MVEKHVCSRLDDPSTEAHALPAADRGGVRTYVRGSKLRPEFPERRSTRLMNSANDEQRAMYSYLASLMSDGSGSESDEAYSPQEDWKKVCKLQELAEVSNWVPITGLGQ